MFPSVVAEAGPLVFREALASGCFPLGTYFAGMGASIDSTIPWVGEAVAARMRLSPDPARLVGDIEAGVQGAFALEGAHREALRSVAVEGYDWVAVAGRLLDALRDAGGV